MIAAHAGAAPGRDRIIVRAPGRTRSRTLAAPVSANDPTVPDALGATAPASVAMGDGSLGAELAGARPAESPGLLLAQARVGGALFGAAVGLGRFRVLERLGGGGMGVVYAAYDPELDRGVALKTVHVPVIGRELALGEAKALARLAHPNIVPVFDVGVAGDHVYIVMELIRGETLGAWSKGRSQREILDAYRQAGHALAAAHAAGLVHRDFKPDNAIVGTDGRVRVVDFGLACEAATEDSGDAAPRVAGTPRYMAPEQAAGAPVTPAADQYSFGIALGEALRGAGDEAPDAVTRVPRWLDAVIEQATARDAAARFGSMPALLRALGRDPARRRRRAIAGAAVVAVVASAFAIGRSNLVGAEEACSGGARALQAAWPPFERQGALLRLATLSPYGNELAASLTQQLDKHTRQWTANHLAACLAHRRGEQSEALLDRRMACLDRGRAGLAALAELTSRAGADALAGVATAARALPDPESCSDVRALAGNVDPPPLGLVGTVATLAAQVEAARIQLAAGHADDAHRTGAAAVATARALGYAPALAEALLVDGHALMVANDRPAAAQRLREATTTGLAAGADALAIEAWARRAWVEGTGPSPPESSLSGLEVVEALASRTPSAFARALLHNNLGSIALARSRRAEARALFERARAEARTVTGPGAVELVAILSNIALVTDELPQRAALLEQAHAKLVMLLGERHPDTLRAQAIRAKTAVTSFADASALLTPVCKEYEHAASLARAIAPCWVEVADLNAERGDRSAALAALDRAWLAGAAGNLNTREVDGYRKLWRDDATAAAAAFNDALRDSPTSADEPWYETYARAVVTLGLGRARQAEHRLPEAAAVLEHSVALLAPLAEGQHSAAIDRRLARARAELARVRAATAASPDQTRALAGAALAWLTAAGGAASELTELQGLAAIKADSPR